MRSHLKSVAAVAAMVAAALAIGVVGAASQNRTTKAGETITTPAATAKAPAAGANFGAARVNKARHMAANSEPGSWISAGRTYDEQRYSPLTQINTGNVKDLGLAWYADINTDAKQEATPVIVDGVLYVSTNWSMVKAFNAKTGEKLWEFDPQVDRAEIGRISCCGTVNRGVAVWEGKVIASILDGRLVSLDAKTGRVIWSVQTTNLEDPHTITGTPRIANGKIFIGNAGAEYTVRGYIGAYDVRDGRQLWRFYTVPGNPNDPNNKDPEILKRYAATWTGEWWKFGGGATAWDAIVYDPKTNLVYFGTGNGLSWSRSIRSPGGGDNLFVSSIIAVNADTGAYAWHYQISPGDEWDFDNTNPLMTADIMVKGRMRHVLMQAPKQAFFYIWDARTGELLSAEKFAPANWAFSIDLKTGRPVENPAVRYTVDKPAIVFPAALGAHNWHPMSFSPRTNLVYFSVTESTTAYASQDPATFQMKARANNTGINRGAAAALFKEEGAPQQGNIRSWLTAWNPTTQKEVWRAPNPVYGASGTMTTAGDLVFTGSAQGDFAAYNARTGQKLWTTIANARVEAAAASYMIDGVQYVAVLAGSSMPQGQVRTSPVSANNSRLLVYKLGGTGSLPTTPFTPPGGAVAAGGRGGAPAGPTLNPPLYTGTNEDFIFGEGLYATNCSGCHGLNGGGGSAPDLRYSPLLRVLAGWTAVLNGSKIQGGMPSFRETLKAGEGDDIFHYIIRRANDERQVQQAAAAGRGGAAPAAPAGGRGGGRGGRGG